MLLPKRRLRSFPRAVKRKMSNYQLKRAAPRGWPQPPCQPPKPSAFYRQSHPPQAAEAPKPHGIAANAKPHRDLTDIPVSSRHQ